MSFHISTPARSDGEALHPASEISPNHREGSTKTPPQFSPTDLLPKFRLPVITKLVTKPKEGILESQVKAPDWSALELFHDRFVGTPPFLPRGGTGTNVLGKIGDGRNAEQLVSLVDGEKWVYSIVEVGKEEDFASRERFHQVGLIYAVE